MYSALRRRSFGDAGPDAPDSLPVAPKTAAIGVGVALSLAFIAYRAGQRSARSEPRSPSALKSMIASYIGWRVLDKLFGEAK